MAIAISRGLSKLFILCFRFAAIRYNEYLARKDAFLSL